MLNGLLYLSSDCKNENPFPSAVFCTGTFAVILKSALNEIEKENKGIRFIIVPKKSNKSDSLYMIKDNKKTKICDVTGYSNVCSIRENIGKILVKNECVITKKFNCSHKVISGKKCTYCKIPDKKI